MTTTPLVVPDENRDRRYFSENPQSEATLPQMPADAPPDHEQVRHMARCVTRAAIDAYWTWTAIERDAFAAIDQTDSSDPLIDQYQNWADLACSMAGDARTTLLRCVLVWNETEHDWGYPQNNRHRPSKGIVADGFLYLAHVNSDLAGVGTEGEILAAASGDAMQLAVIDLASVHRFDGGTGL